VIPINSASAILEADLSFGSVGGFGVEDLAGALKVTFGVN